MIRRSVEIVAPRAGMVVRDTWELLAPLGKGSFGVVFEARHRGLDRVDAIKILHPYLADDEDLRRRFHDEARTMARLRGEHLVTVYDYGEHEGLPFFVMERLVGESLHALVQRAAPLPAEYFFRIAEGILRGLAEIHEHGIIHRDIKPANIFVEELGQRAKMLDFGLAKTSLHLSSRNLQIGTPIYMAPELLVGLGTSASVATDVYAAGVVLYQLLTGTLPFEPPRGGDVMALLRTVTNTTPIGPTFEDNEPLHAAGELVLRALDKVPRRRPGSARDFLDGMFEAKDGTSPASPASPTSPTSPASLASPARASDNTDPEQRTQRVPPPHLDSLPSHVFVCFSHHDEAAALRVAEALSWRDGVSVELGMAGRRSTRTAIEGALAVVLVASPHARASPRVAEDVELALSLNEPVIPVWVQGSRWRDCIDPRLGAVQHVDAREGDDQSLRAQLARALRKIVATTLPPSFSVGPPRNPPWRGAMLHRMRPLRPMPPGVVLVEDPSAVGSGKGHCVRLDRHLTMHAVLDAVYTSLLTEHYPPFSYGKEWILVESRQRERATIAPRVAVPWWWPSRQAHEPKRMNRWATQTGPGKLGMDGHPERACWTIVKVTDEPLATTVAADDPRFFATLEHLKRGRSLFRGQSPAAKLRPWSGFYRADYHEARTYAFPRGWPRGNDGSSVIVQASELPPDDPGAAEGKPSLEELRAWLLQGKR